MFNYMYSVSIVTLGWGVMTLVDENMPNGYVAFFQDLLPF